MFSLSRPACCLAMLLGLALAPAAAHAANITLQGAFARDDQVQLFDLIVAAPGAVDIRSYGYAGGTTATGVAVPRGGLDTILSLFDASGAFLADNDDGAGVAADPLTGATYDARVTLPLTPGGYIVALTQFDNFPLGPALADGFSEAGSPAFTADPGFTFGGPCPSGLFRDTSDTAGQCRTGSWSVEFANVASATARGATPVPEPASLALLGASLAGLGALPMARGGRGRKRARHPGADPAQRPRGQALLP